MKPNCCPAALPKAHFRAPFLGGFPNQVPDSACRNAFPFHPCARVKGWACLINSGSVQVQYIQHVFMGTHLTKLLADSARPSIRISPGIVGFLSLEHVSAAARNAWCSRTRFSHRPASSCKRQVQLPMRRHTWHECGRGATAQKHPYTAVLQGESPNSPCLYASRKKCLI